MGHRENVGFGRIGKILASALLAATPLWSLAQHESTNPHPDPRIPRHPAAAIDPSVPATLFPASVSFPQITTGEKSYAVTVTLTNQTSSTLGLASIKTTGSFSQTNTCGKALTVKQQSCTIFVTFAPKSNGLAAGALTVTETPGNTSQSTGLRGTSESGGLGFTATGLSSSGSAGDYTLTGTVVGYSAEDVPEGTVSFFDTSDKALEIGTATLGESLVSLGLANGPSYLTTDAVTDNYETSQTLVADFNGDGKPDLLAIDAFGFLSASNPSILVWLGNGDGTFRPASDSPFLGYNGAVVGDFNGDGYADIATLSAATDRLIVLFGSAGGTFTVKPTNFTIATAVLAAADFNNDGKIDLAVSEPNGTDNSSNVQILFGQEGGTFTVGPGVAVVDCCGPTLVTDFNNDGNKDLAIQANYPIAKVMLLLGKGKDGFAEPVTTSLGSLFGRNDSYRNFAAGDFNGDGKQDLVFEGTLLNTKRVPVSDAYLVLTGKGNGTFEAGTPVAISPSGPNGSSSGSIAVADFDRDGHPDLAVLTDNVVQLQLNNGKGKFNSGVSVDSGAETDPDWLVLASGDFLGNGLPDLIVANSDTSLLTVLLNQRSLKATATLSDVAIPGSGTQTVEAVYAGDAEFATSTSAGLSLTGSLLVSSSGSSAANTLVETSAVPR